MDKNILNIITSWAKANPLSVKVRCDENTLTLRDLQSQKEISFDYRTIKQHRLKQNAQGLGEYLNLVLENKVEIVLCHVGIAFSPSFTSTGPIADAPPVVCMEDYKRLYTQLLGLLDENERKQDCLMLFQLLISILDGAKLVGMNVNIEEELLEKDLTKFEASFLK